ncbi:carbohydrate porin, partial [Pseudomonas aeruginosa]|nr:carbohydrate porin [Pseudomonas aeruginosa]
AAHAAEAFSPNSKWMLGDWGGKRTELLEKGYDFKLEYVGEAAANLDGGYDDDKTGRYTDQFALGVHMDLEKILGWKATEFQFTVTERNGQAHRAAGEGLRLQAGVRRRGGGQPRRRL